jgi:hypothetical protein
MPARFRAVMPSLFLIAAVTALMTPTAHAAGGKDACDVLKRSEIEHVLGQEIGRPEDLGDTCFWDLEDPDAGTEGIALLVDRGRGAREGYEQGLEALRPDAVSEIDGLGKEAYFAISSIAVLKNKRTALYLSGVYDQAQAEELVRIAVRRA